MCCGMTILEQHKETGLSVQNLQCTQQNIFLLSRPWKPSTDSKKPEDEGQ